MSVYFGRISPHTDKMIARFKQYGITLSQVNFAMPSSIVASVTKGVRSSVFKTASTIQTTKNAELMRQENEEAQLNATRAGATENSKQYRFTPKDYEIIDRVVAQDEWDQIPAVEVVAYKNRPFSMKKIAESASVGKIRIKNTATAKIMVLQRAPSPFAEGSTRIAYHGLLSKQPSSAPYPMVLKSFKFMGLAVNDRKHYLRQMEVSNLARFLALQYNESSARPPRSGFVHVLPVSVIEEEDTKNEESGLRRFCAEPPLPQDANCSTFIRFSSNTGYWNEDELSETLLSFCKYTYDVSNGYLIVTDLQGDRRQNDYFLTDPVILCKNPMRFGSTNVGKEFMQRCIDSTNKYLYWNGWLTY